MKVLKHQHWHLLCLLLLLLGLCFIITGDYAILTGELWGINSKILFIAALLAPILHQIYVLICWRAELFNKSLSRAFGQNAFKLYKAGFALLFASRLVTIILLAISSSHTLNINRTIAYVIAGILFFPSMYLFYSVKKYFSMDRAFGIDHFYPEKFKNAPFVKKGMFKYSSNAMYVYGFLILWIPGFLWLSKAALLLALFNHIYIWVHYYFTELPDIKHIYRA